MCHLIRITVSGKQLYFHLHRREKAQQVSDLSMVLKPRRGEADILTQASEIGEHIPRHSPI